MPTAESLAAELARIFGGTVFPIDPEYDNKRDVKFGANGWAYVVTGIPGTGKYEWLNRDQPAPRFEIGGVRPPMNRDVTRNHWNLLAAQRMTVSAKKSAATIAREIRSRLEGPYLESVAKVLAANEQDNANKAAQASIAKSLGEILGVQVRLRHSGDEPYVPADDRRGKDWNDGVWGDFFPQPNYVKLEIPHMPPDLALAIARTIADWKESR